MLTLEGQKVAAERVGCLKTPNYGVIKRDIMLAQAARFFFITELLLWSWQCSKKTNVL